MENSAQSRQNTIYLAAEIQVRVYMLNDTIINILDTFYFIIKSLQMVTAAMKLKDAYSLEEKL